MPRAAAASDRRDGRAVPGRRIIPARSARPRRAGAAERPLPRCREAGSPARAERHRRAARGSMPRAPRRRRATAGRDRPRTSRPASPGGWRRRDPPSARATARPPPRDNASRAQRRRRAAPRRLPDRAAPAPSRPDRRRARSARRGRPRQHRSAASGCATALADRENAAGSPRRRARSPRRAARHRGGNAGFRRPPPRPARCRSARAPRRR